MENKNHQEPTTQDVLDTMHSLNQDILDALSTFATHVGEDDKVNELTGILENKVVISRTESKKITAMGPFLKKV